MIQRIQTLYLLAATVLVGCALRLPLALFAGDGQEYTLRAFALENASGEALQATIYLGVVLSLAALLPLATLFCYRRRMLQVRLCAAELVLLAGCCVLLGVYYFLCARFFSGYAIHAQFMKPALVLPLVAIVPVVLAVRAIMHDERLVRDADRIR